MDNNAEIESNGGQAAEIENLEFPSWTISGIAADFVEMGIKTYEAPPEFFYFSFLTCFGNMLSDLIYIQGRHKTETRFYTLLLGDSADSRKSTTIKMTVNFFRQYFPDFNVLYGSGSAEGLLSHLQDKPKLLLVYDEFAQFVNKATSQNSVLLPCVNILFEQNVYENRTKEKFLRVDNARISMLCASTVPTFNKVWNASFTDIGFDNRLFIVPGSAERKYPIPREIPESEKEDIYRRLCCLLFQIKKGALELSPEAELRFSDWYRNMKRSVFSARMETYAVRLMMLIALSDSTHISENAMEKAIAICDWQMKARQYCSPIDAEGKYAKVEEAIRRTLKRFGDCTPGKLKKYANPRNFYGEFVYKLALKNLVGSGEVRDMGKHFRLMKVST